ncbi:hypothetical protein [uncultured Clostridium sp.]|jgi:hypothetical protein|uniref:hypothetical protein n=1 Tax=uncultured Clostridium sp. TaxID=59620 RepID=UPI0026033B50|nr:hypothetical protein [uncultured Clostridium sp.]
MKNMKINFNIGINSTTDMTLKVKLFIEDIPAMEVLHLFRSKSKVLDIQSKVEYKEDKDFIHFKINGAKSFELEYAVQVGFLAKHGAYGLVTKDMVAFAGEQALLLPFETLNLASNKNKLGFDLKISYDFDTYENAIVPYKNGTESSLFASIWGNMFEVMKSSYVFTKVDTHNINNNFKLHTNFKVDDVTKNNLNKIYAYYADLFKTEIELNLTSLQTEFAQKLFAGSSKSNICATFDFTNKRDYQLISHRMFHAFMDTRLNHSVFHMPPNLWVTEGLASLYEHKALEVLDTDFKNAYDISFDEELKKLYRTYLYSISKNEKLYSFPPLLEGNLQSNALIEYLHYTKSPLLIKFFEDASLLDGENQFINYLLSLETLENFSQPDMFKNILTENLNDITIKYIFGAEKLHLDIDPTGDVEKIREELTEFERVMSTWFELDKVKNDSSVTDEDLKLFSN